jgi:cytidylate kinase
MNIDELLYIEEKRIINDLASKGACVFIGRCTDYILKDNKDAMHVFIYGDPKVRAERISKGDYEGKESPEKILKEKDNKRATNYAHFTGRLWGDPTNYDLMLNSSKLSFDECVDLIVEAYKK